MRRVPAIPPLKDRHAIGFVNARGGSISIYLVGLGWMHQLPECPSSYLQARSGTNCVCVGGDNLLTKGLLLMLLAFLEVAKPRLRGRATLRSSGSCSHGRLGFWQR